jgi:hypothetical protein
MEDAGLDLNISKTSILPKSVTQQAAFDIAHSIINNSPALTPLNADVFLASFCPQGFIGIGVPTGTDTFVRNADYRWVLQIVVYGINSTQVSL